MLLARRSTINKYCRRWAVVCGGEPTRSGGQGSGQPRLTKGRRTRKNKHRTCWRTCAEAVTGRRAGGLIEATASPRSWQAGRNVVGGQLKRGFRCPNRSEISL